MSRALLALVGAAVACAPTSPGATPLVFVEHQTARFVFRHPSGDTAAISALGIAVEGRADAVIDALQVNGLGPVRVTVYPTHAAMADAVRPLVGVIPSFATGLVTSSRDIHFVWTVTSTPTAVAGAASTVIHEFAHCATLHLRASAGNNPRWLWETVAVYLADQPGSATAVRAFLARGTPTFAVLNDLGDPAIYDVGHSLGAFIVTRGGLPALRALIANGGNTTAVLGLSEPEFLAAWAAWVG